jgi:transposase
VDSQFVGLDATAEVIEIAIRPTGEMWKTDFADENITAMTEKLKYLRPRSVVLEAAGTFELPVAGVFAIQGLPFTMVNPRKVREFARAIGRLSRFASTQAGLLAYFGELIDPEPRPLPEALIEKLRHLRARRDKVLEMLLAEKRYLSEASPRLRIDTMRHINFLEQNVAALNQEFNRTVRCSIVWR